MAIRKQGQLAKPQVAEIDPKFTKRGGESTLPYGRKSTQQGEGVDVRPGTYDRNEMNPQEEQDYPSGVKGHLRSMEEQISYRTHGANGNQVRNGSSALAPHDKDT